MPNPARITVLFPSPTRRFNQSLVGSGDHANEIRGAKFALAVGHRSARWFALPARSNEISGSRLEGTPELMSAPRILNQLPRLNVGATSWPLVSHGAVSIP